MIQEEFKFYKPCKLLQHYVRYYWVFKSNQLLNTLTFPIGCPQIIFHKQTPLYIPELNATQDKMTISGQVNFSSHLYADGNTEMIVVVFQPYAMSMFLNIPTSLFYNQEVSRYALIACLKCSVPFIMSVILLDNRYLVHLKHCICTLRTLPKVLGFRSTSVSFL